MAESYSTQLARVQSAIAAIENGAQSYSVQGRSFSKADLNTLYNREAKLIPLAAREARGGRFMQRAVPLG
jgi:hypothetical protein